MDEQQQAEIRRRLEQDRVWAVYALADLQPELAPYCRWFTHADGDAGAVALLFDGLQPPILFAAGDPAALAAALSGADLPAQVYLSVREEHAATLTQWCDHHDVRHMWRMVLGGARGEGRGATMGEGERGRQGDNLTRHSSPITGETGRRGDDLQSPNLQSLNLPIFPDFTLRRLTGADVLAVKALFAHGGPFTPDAFAAHQVELGVFYGIEDEHGALAAVGGTHIVDYTARLAAIGNMYTRPDCRGRGFARAVLAAIVANLQADGVATIVLNVDHRNTGARRIYERFGFVVHCPYIEGVATAKI
jgi:GNAT superfamily N-acetyltransferase